MKDDELLLVEFDYVYNPEIKEFTLRIKSKTDVTGEDIIAALREFIFIAEPDASNLLTDDFTATDTLLQ
jgi:hypothetical protein